MQVHGPCFLSRMVSDIGVRADEDDPSSPHRQRLSVWLPVIDRVNVAIPEHEVGCRLPGKNRRNQGKREDEGEKNSCISHNSSLSTEITAWSYDGQEIHAARNRLIFSPGNEVRTSPIQRRYPTQRNRLAAFDRFLQPHSRGLDSLRYSNTGWLGL